jgi:pyruvate/2-oxoglutarate dehydrogenase complex dihydrolipoamide dehydrogenase (E3) component/uncharacterized membrane protein YdjX (TVP38/TMEM64 family)
MAPRTFSRLAVAAAVVAAFAAFFAAGGQRYLTFESLKAQQAALQARYAAHPAGTALGFFALYVAYTGLSLPGAALLTLVAGAVFGLVGGTLLVSFASSLGATIAFLAARFVLRDWVQQRFEGAFYLFLLRLTPAVPFFVINLAMGLTPMRAATFYWVSQLGMLAGTLVYVNAGTQLASLASPRDVLSWPLALALLALGAFPFVARKAVDAARAGRVYARWTRPRRFDRNLVVIGAGSAGLVAAYIAAALRARVTLVEKDRMGGDCLNTGCVPSKALLRAARLAADVRRAHEFGLRATAEVDFAAVMERVARVVRAIAPHDSVERYNALGVECLHGEARITSPWTVEIDGRRTLTTRAIVVAAGARPALPPIPGIEGADVLTSDNVWQLRELPRHLVVLGGGPVGCELAQAFARLVCEAQGREVEIPFDRLLCALGRVANTAGYGLEELGIPVGASRTVETNEFLQTVYPNIYACGDVAGPWQFTHTASHQAWYAAVNALFAPLRRFRVDTSAIPWTTFTEPEVARVGLNESEAMARGVAHEATLYRLDELDRAIADGAAEGFVKVLTPPGSDRVLGATIAGERAGELIGEFVSAMKHGIGLKKLLSTIHVYPTFAEANKYAAGAWRRAHAPQRVLGALQRFHAWRRG